MPRLWSLVIQFRWFLFLFSVALLTSCERDTSRAIQAAAPAANQGDGAGSVWVVDSPGTGGRLFLCGTIHILRQEDYPLSPAYEAAYEASDKLVLELPPGAGNGSTLAARMAEVGTYPAGSSLAVDVGPELWKRVQAWAKRRNVAESALNRLRPWFVGLVITATEYAALGAKPDKGVDQHFEQRAAKDGKPGEGLETVEFQLQLFTQLSQEQQRDMLEQTLEEIDTLSAEYEEMIGAWKHGKLEALAEMLFREAEKYPDLMELFLTARNRKWLEPLEAMLRKGDKAMVLVGAGHLASETGLVQLLKDRGYAVRHYRDVKDL